METGKRCLIVVDYQKDFVDGSLGFEKAVTLDHGIAEKIRLYHSRGDDVMFTLDTHNDDYPTTQEGKKSPRAALHRRNAWTPPVRGNSGVPPKAGHGVLQAVFWLNGDALLPAHAPVSGN